MTRSNVYAGPAGFYLLRGGPGDAVTGVLPGPAPALGDPAGTRYYEIPIAIQDRSFNADGSFFYPGNRAFFEGLNQPPAEPYLDIPFIPERACRGRPSDVSPIFNPEFFGNTLVVNGTTWPYLEVEPRRYRFRFLNGCNSRFLVLRMSNGLPFWQIGAEGGFLPAPVQVDRLLLGLAERADVIVDFANVGVGTEIVLLNLGPDEPFGGGVPGVDFAPADEATTGQVMQFRVVPATSRDTSTPPNRLVLPALPPLPGATRIRQVSLNEEDSQTVRVSTDAGGNVVLDCARGAPFGPRFALLGTVAGDAGVPLRWDDPITENPDVGATEVWEMYNFTEDAHPIHIHEVMFQVLERQRFGGPARGPEAWETGRKDTVIAYPGEITRVKATFDRAGLFVWHCHIVEHEDHEMMRPYRIGP
jgi:FtsP/CotA-like multicopper oxidase with cupredoxin domain